MSAYYEFEVKLLEVSVAPTRRFLLNQRATFLDLHDALQHAFSWEGKQWWGFGSSPGARGDIADRDGEQGPRAEHVKLISYFGEALGEGASQVRYTYGVDAGWSHLVAFNRVVTRHRPTHWRELLDGAHIAPPEYFSGVADYERWCVFSATGEYPQGTGKVEAFVASLARHGISRERLATFDLDAQRRRFDVLLDPLSYQHLFTWRASPPARRAKRLKPKVKGRRRVDKDLIAIPRPDASDFQAHLPRFLDYVVAPSWMSVFELLQTYLLVVRSGGRHETSLGMCTWLYILVCDEAQGDVLQPSSPPIQAAMVIYWLDALFEQQPSFPRLAEQFDVSAASIESSFAQLNALMEGDALAPETFGQLLRFYAEAMDVLNQAGAEAYVRALAPESQVVADFAAQVAELAVANGVLESEGGAQILDNLLQYIQESEDEEDLARRMRELYQRLGLAPIASPAFDPLPAK